MPVFSGPEFEEAWEEFGSSRHPDERGPRQGPRIITDPEAQGYHQTFDDTMEDGTPVETVKGL